MHRLKFVSCLFALFLFAAFLFPKTLSQSPQGNALQTNQLGINTFVSGPNRSVFLLLNTDLFRNLSPAGDQWERLTANVRAVALDPGNEKVIYALSSRNGVIKSMDGGKNWLNLNTGAASQAFSAIFVNPANPQQVYVGGGSGLLKTEDAGFTWQTTGFIGPVSQIAIDPLAPDVLYLLSAGGIYISRDHAANWKRAETGLPTILVRGANRTAIKVTAPVSLIAAIGRHNPQLLAATVGKGVFRSDDNGATWVPSSAGLDLADDFVAASIGKQQITLASESALFRSVDGANWSRVKIASGKKTPAAFLGVIDYPFKDGLLLNFRFPEDGEIENVGTQRRIGLIDPQGVLIGLNYGVLLHSESDGIWTTKKDGKPVLFAVTFNDGELDQVERWHRPAFLYTSKSDGYSWDLIGKPDCGNSATRPRGAESETWEYGGACAARTSDGGETWQQMPGFDFVSQGAIVNDFKFDPVHPNVLYYSAGVNERHIFRYQYNPETRQGQAVDLKTTAAGLVIDQTNPLSIFTDKAQLSTDGGWTWADKSHPLETACKSNIKSFYVGMAKSLSFHAGEIRVLLASDPNAFNGYPGDITVLRSPDSGDTWAPIAKLPAHGLRAGPFSNPDDPQDFFIAAVSAPGGTPGAFGDSFRVNAVKVLETRDGGATWKVIYQNAASGQNPGMGFLHGVAQIAHGSDRSILLATNKGLLRSDDEGNTWIKLGGLQVDGSSSAANAQGAGGNKTEPSGPYHVGGNISAPKVLYSVEAQLTSEARRAHYQGTCVVGFTVDAEGIPQDVHIVRPLEYGLNEAAMEAVRKYRFTPAYKDETTPVPVLLQIAIEFKQY